MAALAGIASNLVKRAEQGDTTNPHVVLAMLTAIERTESSLRSVRPEDDGRLLTDLLADNLPLRVKQRRYMTGLSVEQVSAAAGISADLWVRVECGHLAGQTTLHQIAAALAAYLRS